MQGVKEVHPPVKRCRGVAGVPRSAPRRCHQAGCRQLITNPRDWLCNEHEKMRQQKVNSRRTTTYYGPAWREISREYLRTHPRCLGCVLRGVSTRATEVDHIVPLRAGGTNDLELPRFRGVSIAFGLPS